MTQSAVPPDHNINTQALAQHRAYRGKIQTMAKCPIRSRDDLAIWYTPGVAAPSRAIASDPAQVHELTNKANNVAIVSDGSRVLGLGDIGPLAALPVMEGKALLFKHFGGVDAVPICLDCHETDEIVAVVKAIAPSFGGINLEDIAAPKCFRILDQLRTELPIPVWHDDQQGTATAVLAGLRNALQVTGKNLAEVRIALIGIGAANMAVFRLLKSAGVSPAAIVACDSKETLHTGRTDLEDRQDDLIEKWQVCLETNPGRISGGIPGALKGADVCIAFSRPGPGVIPPEAIGQMAADPIVFACANPVPEIWPAEAEAAGAAIVATGRSDFDNQVNNSLVFPGLFRGVLDVRATDITEAMASAAADAIAAHAVQGGLGRTSILPPTDNIGLAASVAAAVGARAGQDGLAANVPGRDVLFQGARSRIEASRAGHDILLASGLLTPRAAP